MAKPLYKNLTIQVLAAVAVGAAIGALDPKTGEALKPLADGFLRLVKMIVGPVVFLTIAAGIAGMGDLGRVGRIGGKALVYFELVTTAALGIGLLVANVLRPGAGVTPKSDPEALRIVRGYAAEAKKHGIVDFILGAIPDNAVGAFASGELLQVLVFSVFFGVALASLRERASPVTAAMERLTEVVFRIVGLIMRLAPVGAMGAIAYTVGKYGLDTLVPLAKLMGCVYLTMILFIVLVLGGIARLAGFSLWRYLVFIREEITLVLGTSSSESALPRLIEKLELMGCPRGVVGLVVPAGYSFNLDGTSIYLSMAVLFIAQAYGVELPLPKQLYILLVLMLTSKGAAAVTGAGFITLAATISATHDLPIEGLALLLGVDRFMSEARAITNLIGNGVAGIVVSRLEGQFDAEQFRMATAGRPVPGRLLPEVAADLGRDGSS